MVLKFGAGRGFGHGNRRTQGRLPLANAKIVQIGDSIGAGSLTSGYTAVNNLGYAGGVTIDNTMSVTTTTIQQIFQNTAPNGFGSYYDGAKPTILIIQRGTNDFGNAGRTSDQVIADFARVALMAKLQGFYVVGQTILPRSDAGWNGTKESYRIAFNAALRARSFSSGGINFVLDGLIDGANDATLSAPSNATYYVDGLHLTVAGQDKIADDYRIGLNALSGRSAATKTATSIAGASLSSAAYGTGPFGLKAMNGGTGTIPTLPNTISLPVTVECWLSWTGTPGLGVFIGQGNPSSHLWYIANSGSKIQASTKNSSGTSVDIVTTGNYNDGNWHHVALVMTGSGATLYVDGANVGSNAIAAHIPGAVNPVGLRQITGLSFPLLAGSLAQVLVTNAAKYASNFTPPAAPFGCDGVGGVAPGGVGALGALGFYDLNGDGVGLK